MIILLEKCKRKIKKWYYKRLFIKWTGCDPKNLTVLGKIQLQIPRGTCEKPSVIVGDNVTLYEGVCLWGDGQIEIGNNTTLFRDVTVYAGKNGGVFIGDDVMVAGFCYITDSNHGMKLRKGLLREQEPVAKPIVIENNVWLGQGVTVLGGGHIHSGAVVGAQSLVNGEIAENTVAVGTPAKVLRNRE